MRQVVVTGIGLVHPRGEDPSILDAVFAEDPGPVVATIAELDYKRYFPDSTKRIKKMDMAGRYASYAAMLALRSTGLEKPPVPQRSGLVTGTMFGGLEACEAFHREMLTAGPDAVNPVHFPNTAHNVAAGHVAISLGLQGPVLALASGLSASLEAILAGTRMIRAGRADLVAAGGFERWFPTLAEALGAAGIPVGAGGLAPSEGACFLILEAEEMARARDARIRGRILTYGQASGSPSTGGSDPEGKALSRALGLALARADGAPDLRIACLGTQGLAGYDRAIAAGWDSALSGGVDELVRITPKRALGETFGVAGALAVASILRGWETGRLPPGSALVDGLSWGGAASALLVAGGDRGQ